MAVDFDIRRYMTPSLTAGFSDGTTWYKPFRLASLNLSGGSDTVPGVHQYIVGRDFDDGLRIPVELVKITKTLDQGSWAHVEIVTHSDRDVFDITDNELSAHMMPRMSYPLGSVWEINLKAKADVAFPSPAMFRGVLTDISIVPLSDVVKVNQQDGLFRISMDLMSFDAHNLRKDDNAGLWYHRENGTTDQYHLRFTPQDSITFNDMVTLIVAWMNAGRPTKDFPITYSYTPIALSPYTLNIFDPIAYTMANDGIGAATVTFTNGSTAVTGVNTVFTSDLQVGQLIAPDSNITGADRLTVANWGKIASITDDTHLVLSAVYGGTTRASAASSKNVNTMPLVVCRDRPTWNILRDVLSYMGGLEGLANSYIPQLSIDGVVSVTHGGYDKTYPSTDDFRDETAMVKDTSTVLTHRFNLIQVLFTAAMDSEYWIKLTLSKWNGVGWDVVHETDYIYWKYDAKNTHASRYFNIPVQEAGTYKWDTDLVTAGSVVVIPGSGGGYAYSPSSYQFLNSPIKQSCEEIKTFVTTTGKCSMVGIYDDGSTSIMSNLMGCMDGGINGGNNKCPDLQGCYPDPGYSYPITGTSITVTHGSKTVTGIGTSFTSELEIGWKVALDSIGVYYTIDSIESDTSLTLTVNHSGSGTGAGSYKEGVNRIYGILGQAGDYPHTSNLNSRNTKCRLQSKRIYKCFQNLDTSVRDPAEVLLVFNDGYTTDSIGEYVDVYSFVRDETIRPRINEQTHLFRGKRLRTTMNGFRI